MSFFKKMSACGAGIITAAALGASANAAVALLDLTDSSIVDPMDGVNSTSVFFNSTNITFQAFINNNPTALMETSDTVSDTTASFCAAQGGDYACERDGIGINNDEIENVERLDVTFDREVKITGLAFLDLFCQVEACDLDPETAMVTYDEGMGPVTVLFDGTEVFSIGGNGFFETPPLDIGFITTISFMFALGNDAVGVGDFALAGIEFAPVPVPAAGLLFGTALAGAAAARRRKKA